MDRSLEDVISERQSRGNGPRGRRDGRRDDGRRDARNGDWPRDGVRKVLFSPHTPNLGASPYRPARRMTLRPPQQRNSPQDLDKDWVHDRYEGDQYSRRGRDDREPRDRDRDRRIDSHRPGRDDRGYEGSAKLRVDNLHYDLNESDLRELFNRIGPIKHCEILYDRSDRSRGTAFVTYEDVRDAQSAIREFDGANAYGQPIKLTLVTSAPTAPRGPRSSALDSDHRAGPSSRSLFDRIEPTGRSLESRVRRSVSPDARNKNIDRYVPGKSRSRSPRPRRGAAPRGAPRRPGARREDSGRKDRDRDGRVTVQGRPRKTAEELDAEMNDYWGGSNEPTARNGTAAATAPVQNAVAAPADDGDVDMIE